MPGNFTSNISISFVEIYNENIFDLFIMNNEKLKIGFGIYFCFHHSWITEAEVVIWWIYFSQGNDGNVVVKGASEVFVKDVNDAMEVPFLFILSTFINSS